VAGTVLGPTDTTGEFPANMNQLIVLVKFTIGSLTSGQVKVEFSHDGTTYYQQTFTSISTGTSTASLGEYSFTASGNYRFEIPIKDNYIKISGKGTGTVTGSSMTIDAVIGVV
jgi:hypothetical protein